MTKLNPEPLPSQLIMAYLERQPCTNCIFDDGVLVHCKKCQGLYDRAIFSAKGLGTMTATERLQVERQRAHEVGLMKNSHSWVGSLTFIDPGRTRMAPYASHCKACGIPMTTFKAKPAECPKANK